MAPAEVVRRAEVLVAAMLAAHDPVRAAELHDDFQRATGYCLLLLGDGVSVAKLPERTRECRCGEARGTEPRCPCGLEWLG